MQPGLKENAGPVNPASSKPPAPPRPVVSTQNKLGKGRRFYLKVAWISFITALTAMFFGTIRFLFPNVLSLPPTKFKVGTPKNYDEGEVETRFQDKGFWIVRNQGIIYALSTVCTHLGCHPNWLPTEKKFKCPCHGSGFYITGVNFEGPAPRPLERFDIQVGEDGQMTVDMARHFQKELGQWSNPDSFVHV